MLEYDKIDISQGIDINKTSASKECDISHYCSFLNKNFSHDLMQNSTSFDDVFILSIKENEFIWYMSKNDAINLMNNSSLNYKTGLL